MSLVLRHLEEGVATVTLNRPELHNAFNEEVMTELTSAFLDLGNDDAARVVVLAGAGRSFCAGADVNWMKRMVEYTFDENVADAAVMARMLRTIRECPKPVIARIHGAAIGGGVGLAAACDIAAAVSAAVFSLSEVKLGIVPAVISPFVLEKIGAGHARRYGLTAERFDAAEARRIGLIAEVLDSRESLDAWIAKTAALLKENAPGAMAVCKQVLTEVRALDWERVTEITTRRIAERRASPEGQEGLKAFLEKRSPNWILGE